jgi:hypothetical protein
MPLQMFYVQGLTTAAASGIVTAMVLPLAQMQHMHDLGWVALAGTVGMLVSVLVVVGKLLYSFFYPSTASDDAGAAVAAGAVRAAHTELFASSSYNVALVGVMDIVFTFGGQVGAGWGRSMWSLACVAHCCLCARHCLAGAMPARAAHAAGPVLGA